MRLVRTLFTSTLVTTVLAGILSPVIAAEPVDLSDPMAVYTSVGGSYGTEGANLKMGLAYDTGNDATIGMHIIEVKNMIDDDSDLSLRYRHFGVDLTNGRGTQIDVNHNAEEGVGTASYGIMQMLPVTSNFAIYPVLAAGIQYDINSDKAHDPNDGGLSVPGAFVSLTAYSKFTINENWWLNYNPTFLYGVAGQLNGEDVLVHEFAISRKVGVDKSVRLYHNLGNNDNFKEGETRLEFNMAF
jgi:hypothetical protein